MRLILGRYRFLVELSFVQDRRKWGRSSGSDKQRGQVGSTEFWLNLALFACRMYDPVSIFARKLAATRFLEAQPPLGQRWCADRGSRIGDMYFIEDFPSASVFVQLTQCVFTAFPIISFHSLFCHGDMMAAMIESSMP